jgi:myo-inositol catabolism protein IolS
MIYRNLGKTETRVSAVTFGCWELGGGPWEFTSDQNNIRLLQKAFELGITSFDTAEGYGDGHSEEIIGQALRSVRDRCFIASKVSRKNLLPKDVRNSAEQSLRRLQTEYMDLYYIHWPSPDIPVGETLSEFQKLKDEGKIRAIAVSNFSIEQLKEAAQYAQIDGYQPEYSLLHRAIEQELVPYCQANDIGIFSYSSIAKGILTGAFHQEGRQLPEDDFRANRRLFTPEHIAASADLIAVMRNIAQGKGVSVSQIAVAWLLHKPGMTSAIVGTQSESHLVSNALAADIVLNAEEMRMLGDASRAALEIIGY